MTPLVSMIFSFLIGLAVGSFLNVLIARIPKGESVVFPASHCPTCGNTLKPWHNVPLLSWLALRGRCAFCRGKISVCYPLVELLTGLLFVAVWSKTGLGLDWVIISLIFALLLALSLIDFEYFAVPDSLNFAALALALLLPLVRAGAAWIGEENALPYLTQGLQALKSAAVMAAVFFLLGAGVKRLIKKEALGEADIIIAATMGALLGIPLAFIAVYIAALLALLPAMVAKNHMVPFVPFLATATWVAWAFDHPLLSLWERLYA